MWVDDDGLHAAQALPAGKNALCIFEHVYFARPDSEVFGESVNEVRTNLGRLLNGLGREEESMRCFCEGLRAAL